MNETASNVDSVMGTHEFPLLESTTVDTPNPCNEYCNTAGVLGITDHIHDVQDQALQETNPKKRKLEEQLLKVSFIGKLAKEHMIYNIPVRKRRKCNKW